MLYLNHFNYAVGNNLTNIEQMYDETLLSRDELMVYKNFYGLAQVPITKDIHELTKSLLEKVTQWQLKHQSIDYIVYIHTGAVTLPFPKTIFSELRVLSCFADSLCISMSQYKCASFFKALMMLNDIMYANEQALIFTSEVAYTPKLRVLSQSSIVGDAAACMLVSRHGVDHLLLAIKIHLVPGCSQGIYMTYAQCHKFNHEFISTMVFVILDAIKQARLHLSDISLIIPHNINELTWRKIAKQLVFSYEKIYTENIAKYGHCFCSDHIQNLTDIVQKNNLRKGEYYLMAACGLGGYFSVAVFQY